MYYPIYHFDNADMDRGLGKTSLGQLESGCVKQLEAAKLGKETGSKCKWMPMTTPHH